MSADLSAKITNVYINDDGSDDVKYDVRILKEKIYQYTGKNFNIEYITNKSDASWFGFMSLLQNKTGLGEAMEEWFPADEVKNEPSIFPTYRDLKEGLDNLEYMAGGGEIISHTFSLATRLYGISQTKNKQFTAHRLKEAFSDVNGHYEFITCTGAYKNKLCLGLSVNDYGKLSLAMKKLNVAERAVKLVNSVVSFVGVVSKKDTLSNNKDIHGIENYINSHMKTTIEGGVGRLNIIAHGDGALLVNKALDRSLAFDEVVRLETTGSMDNHTWGDGKNFSLLEDIVTAAVPDTLLRNSGFTNFPYSVLNSAGEYWLLNYKKFAHPLGHDFSGVYLSGNENTTGKIVKQFVKNYEELKSLDDYKPEIEKQENLWLGDIELEGYGKNVPQRKSIKFDSRAFYSSNVKPGKRKVQICYALSKSPYWRYSDFVRGPKYSSKVFTTKESSQKISNVSFLVTKNIPLGEYYMLVNINCHKKVKETDYDENQVKFAKITVIDDEVEDVYTTEPRVSGSGTKINIKNTMVYRGSTPDIGDVYNLYYISDQPKFSTAQRFISVKVRMGWVVRQRITVSTTINIAKLPPRKYYIWVVTQTPDLSHDNDTSNNHFRMSFVVQKKE